MTLIRPLFQLTALASLLLLLSCSKKENYTIGFSGQLTGKFSDLGTQGRNGATLAIEQINVSGGINGRKLSLIAVDDKNSAKDAVAADLSLIDSGVVAIIGHMTSGISTSVLSEVEKANGILVSPTTATSLLTGKRDNFFRIISETSKAATALADYTYNIEKVSSVVIVSDSSNAAYSDAFAESFTTAFKLMGGTIIHKYDFTSQTISRMTMTVNSILDSIIVDEPERILAICSAKDLGALSQQLSISESKIKLISAPWGYTKEVIQRGGRTVNGVVFVAFYADDLDYAPFIEFKKDYIERFGFEANFAAAFAYEAVQLIEQALIKRGASNEDLKNFLCNQEVAGIMGNFKLNEFGDSERTEYIVTIEDGKFITISTVNK
jgi:branched-chain amino acid transport system substrate-binding protein